jgi:hypothetical protein
MLGSSYPSLRAKVELEKAKLDNLKQKPNRYILATSQSLTSANVDELFRILLPYCKSPEDILDAASIEDMLARHPNVLRRHYKLWITSTPVLHMLLHSGIYNRSQAHVMDLLAKSRTFVQPDVFVKAQQILREHHTCIISGPPGVGKTTLADMLCREYLANDFELIVVSEAVLEADNVYRDSSKQVFVYDDFLGRTDLREKLGKNEDSRIVQFIRRVSESPNHRFILTTREYILRAARIRYDRLDVDDINPLNLVLGINSYTEYQRGLILYQHLAFHKEISGVDIQEFVSNRRYWQVVRHPNYTPRHITDALDQVKRRYRANGSRIALADELLAVLDNPMHMWTHALKELSGDAQRLFLTLALLPGRVSTDALRTACTAQAGTRSEPFMDSLRSIEGSFVFTDRVGRFSVVKLRHPSLQDFANKYLDDNPDVVDTLLSAPMFYEQIIGVFTLAMARVEQGNNSQIRIPANSRPKYPEVGGWVERHADRLIAQAVGLLDARGIGLYLIENGRIRELLEIMATYGMPPTVEVTETLRKHALKMLTPANQSAGDNALEVLKKPVYRDILSRILQEDAVTVIRRNVLAGTSWKYRVLVRLDSNFKVNPSESWQSWGAQYVAYARRLVADAGWLRDTNTRTIRDMIDDLVYLKVTFDADLDDEIAELEERMNSSHYGDVDFDSFADSDRESVESDDGPSDAELDWAYECEQLEQIFDGLL